MHAPRVRLQQVEAHAARLGGNQVASASMFLLALAERRLRDRRGVEALQRFRMR